MEFSISPSAAAWAVLGLGVVSYDLLAPKGETLSEGVDRALEHPYHKYLCAAAVGATALHLLNILPPAFDPIYQFFKYAKTS